MRGENIIIDFNRDYKPESCYFTAKADPKKKQSSGYAWRTKEIFLLDPSKVDEKDAFIYPFIILHEIGHSKKHLSKEPPVDIIEILEFEIEAWDYAFKEAVKHKRLGNFPYSEHDLYNYIKICLRLYINERRLRETIKDET